MSNLLGVDGADLGLGVVDQVGDLVGNAENLSTVQDVSVQGVEAVGADAWC